MNIETLAKMLHESMSEVVEQKKTIGQVMKLHNPYEWLEWDELHEDAKEGRRIQARYLLDRYFIALKIPNHHFVIMEDVSPSLPEEE